MEPITWITGGLLISVVSGVVGKSIGTNDNVKDSTCKERQEAFRGIIIEKIDGLSSKFDNLEKSINSRINEDKH